MAHELRGKGYKIEKASLGRFGYLLVCKNMELLAKHPDLLLAAGKIEASGDFLSTIEKGIKN